MPRYIVQRTFASGLHVPVNSTGAMACEDIVAVNARRGVTWIQSYVSNDLRNTFCVYDGPSPEAIRAAAADNNMSVDIVTEVRVLDPYFYN